MQLCEVSRELQFAGKKRVCVQIDLKDFQYHRPSLQYLDVVGCKQSCQKTTLKNMAEELLGGGLDIDGKAFESDQIIR